MKLLEWIGVRLLDVSAWCTAASRFFYAQASRCIVRARPIPRPAPLPRVEVPSDVPSVADVGVGSDEPTLTETRIDVRVNALGGLA